MRALRGGRLRCLRWGRGVLVLLGVCLGVLASGAAGAHAAQIEWQQGLGFTKDARLTAQINPQGVDTTCAAQYTSGEAYEREEWATASTVPCSPEDLGGETSGERVAAEVVGLSLNTVYEYRFLLTSGASTVPSATGTFTTFGIEAFSLTRPDSRGYPATRAGGRPYELVANIRMKSSQLRDGNGSADAQLDNVKIALPPGLIGDPSAVPKCPQRLEEVESCPPDTQIGTLAIRLASEPTVSEAEEEPDAKPLFNLIPPKGVAARFGTQVNLEANAFIDAGVRTGSDYGVEAASLNITSFAQPKRMIVTMWGEPASPSHDAERVCPGSYQEKGCAYEGEGKPFLRNPTSCDGAQALSATVNSYQEQDELVTTEKTLHESAGCGMVPFEPSIEAHPSAHTPDSPAGLALDVTVPQKEEAKQTASSDLKDAMITLPAGMTVNPSAADGLAACSEKRIGFTGFKELNPEGEPGVRTAQFTPAPAECPDAAKLGTVQIDTPLIKHPLPGAIYLATPHRNPFGSLVAMYLTVNDPVTGIVVKLPGLVHLDPETGRITAIFNQDPQLPFLHLKVNLFANEKRAALTTPLICGSYVTTGVLAPWDGNPAATPESEPFSIGAAPGGGACPGTEAQAPNAPGLTAGTASPIAGTYSPFVLKLAREDGSQRFEAMDVTLPPGLVGKVAGVEECPQANIEAAERLTAEGDGAVEEAHPSCPVGSRLGVVHVGAGSGAPFFVNGTAYFAGPYKGAPFSLVFITPAIAGPFDLGVVTVRAGLYVNPETAQVSVKSDPFPTILDGIPLDIRSVGVEMTRPDFTLNPTSCNVMAITGNEASTAGSSAPLSERFQVGGCNGMPFNPAFTAVTQAKTSREDGASLATKVSYPAGALGRQANMRYVKVKLPRQLPVRSSALHNACPGPTFESNPAACPAGSVIGHAVVHTPILPVALTGPAYFVGHGAVKFPELIVVLQGDGVTVELRGNTYIAANGVISTTFKNVPDVPFESFELSLPEGPDSALSPGGNLCYRTITKKKRVLVHRHGHLVKRSHRGRHDRQRFVHRTKKIRRMVHRHLQMPLVMIGQNGVELHSKAAIHVTGCGKAHTAKHHHHNKTHDGRHGRHAGRSHHGRKHAKRK